MQVQLPAASVALGSCDTCTPGFHLRSCCPEPVELSPHGPYSSNTIDLSYLTQHLTLTTLSDPKEMIWLSLSLTMTCCTLLEWPSSWARGFWLKGFHKNTRRSWPPLCVRG